MTTVVHANVLLRQRGPSLALAPIRHRRRLSTIVREHAPVGRKVVPLVFRAKDGPWALADRRALDRAARLRAQYRTTTVGPNDTVVLMALPLGGGGGGGGGRRGGKSFASIGLAIASIALMAVAGPIAAAIGAPTFAVQAGVAIGVAAIAYAAQRSSSAKRQQQQSEFFGLTGGGNLPRPGDRKPVLYGTCWSSPPLSQKDYSLPIASSTVLYKRLTLGLGKYQVEQIRVGESLFWDREQGVQAPFDAANVIGIGPAVEILYNSVSQIIPGDIVSSDSVQGQELPRPGQNPGFTPWFRLTPQGVTARIMDLTWQYQALTAQNPKGGNTAAPGAVIWQAQRLDPTTGSPVGEVILAHIDSILAMSNVPVHRGWRVNLPEAAEWQVRAQNFQPLNDTIQNGANWDGMYAILEDHRARPGTTEIVMRVVGTKGLPITSLSDVQVKATRILPVWQGSAWTEEPTRKAVWAYADLVRSEYGLNQPDAVDKARCLAYANRTDLVGRDEYNGPIPSVSSFWEAAGDLLHVIRADPIKVGLVHTFVRDESAAEAGGRRVVTRRQIVRDSGSQGFTVATDETPRGDVIVEFARDGDPKRPDEVRQDRFPLTRTPKRYRVAGITSGAHALHHARWLGAIDLYRGATRRVTTEWDGRLITPGTHILSDLWFIEGKAVAGIEGVSGTTLTLDATPEVAAGQVYCSLRNRKGREWGVLQATYDGLRSLALSASAVAAVTAATGIGLAEVVARDTQDPTTVVIATTLTEQQETYIARSAEPEDDDHVTIEMVLDDERVWQILQETVVGPAPVEPDQPLDPLVPVVQSVRARCQTVETGIEVAWGITPARGAVAYDAQLSYDLGETWEDLVARQPVVTGRKTMRQSEVAVVFRARGYGATDLSGPWKDVQFQTVAPRLLGELLDPASVVIAKLDTEAQRILTGEGPGSVHDAKEAAEAAENRATDLFDDIERAFSADPLIRSTSSSAAKAVQDAIDTTADAALQLRSDLSQFGGRLREAGFEPGPGGAYRIRGIEEIRAETSTRFNEVDVLVDALNARIGLVASSIVSGQVDGSALFAQLTEVAVDLDAIAGLLSLKASQASLDGTNALLSSALIQLQAQGSILLQTTAGTLPASVDLAASSAIELLDLISRLKGQQAETFAFTVDRMSSRIEDGVRAVAESYKALVAVREGANAQYVETIKVVAEKDQAQTVKREQLSAQVNDPTSGLPAALSRISNEEIARATADYAEAVARTALYSQVNAPETGLPAAFSRIVTEENTRANADNTNASLITGLTSQVNAPGTGLPATLARLVLQEQTQATDNDARAQQTSTLSTQVNDPTTGLPKTRAEYLSNALVQSDFNGNVSSTLSSLTGRMGDAEASVVQANQARILGDDALAQVLTAVDAKSNYGSASGQLQFAAYSGPSGTAAAWRLQLVSGGASSGFSVLQMGDGTSRIMVNASQFLIGDGSDGVPFATFDAASRRLILQNLTVTNNLLAPGAIFRRAAAVLDFQSYDLLPASQEVVPGSVREVTSPGPATIIVFPRLVGRGGTSGTLLVTLQRSTPGGGSETVEMLTAHGPDPALSIPAVLFAVGAGTHTLRLLYDWTPSGAGGGSLSGRYDFVAMLDGTAS